MNIYLICTGNTCRSPMAEAILRARKIEGVAVRSAGIHGFDGMPISTHAKTVLEKSNIPYTETSNAVTMENVKWAHAILTMTDMHKRVLQELFPEEKDKIHTLKGFLGQDGHEDVQDPFGGTLQTYTETFNELSTLMEVFERKLAGE